MTYANTNHGIYSTANPVMVIITAGEGISGPYKVHNGTMASNILEYANDIAMVAVGSGFFLTDLNDDKYKLSSPITITLQQESEDEYIVSFPEAELSRSGETAREALDWLKSSMVSLYELYKVAPRLGPLPTRQLRVLGKYIVAKPHSKK